MINRFKNPYAIDDAGNPDNPQDADQPTPMPAIPAVGTGLAAPAQEPATAPAPSAPLSSAPPPAAAPSSAPPPATPDPATLFSGEMVNSAAAAPAAPPPANVDPIPTNLPTIAPAMGANVDPQMQTPALGAAQSAATGGVPDFSNLSIADAVQARYRWEREQENATGVAGKEQDYSTQGMIDAGAWKPSAEEQAAQEARRQQIINDPTTSPGIKKAFEAGAGTYGFDRALNTPGTPESQYMDVLSKPTHEYTLPAPSGPDRILTGGVEQYRDGAPVPGGYNAEADKAKQLAAQGAPIPSVGGGLADVPAPRAAPTGPANDASGGMMFDPSGGITESTDMLRPPPTGPANDTSPSIPKVGGAALSSFGPGNDLRSTQIAPDQTVDRVALAKKVAADFRASRQPQHDANVRHILEGNAGLGRLGSGMLNTDVGNEANAFEQQQTDLERQLENSAVEGTIGDQANARNELRTERGYQTSTAEQALRDQIQQYLLEQQGQQQDFSNGLSLATLGYGNSPSSQLFGAGQSYGQAAQGSFGNLGDLLAQYFAGQKKAA